jgi:hypothetical protein
MEHFHTKFYFIVRWIISFLYHRSNRHIFGKENVAVVFAGLNRNDSLFSFLVDEVSDELK